MVARIWGPEWAGMEIDGQTDNELTELFLRHNKSKIDKRLAMGRVFAMMQHHWGFRWVPSRVWPAQHPPRLLFPVDNQSFCFLGAVQTPQHVPL